MINKVEKLLSWIAGAIERRHKTIHAKTTLFALLCVLL